MAHADYTCCACCDSKVTYTDDARPKTVLCETCIQNISELVGTTVATPQDFKEVIRKYSDGDELFQFLKKLGFEFCFYKNELDMIVANKVGLKHERTIKNNYNVPKPMKIIVIKTDDKYYISDNLTGDNLHMEPGRTTKLGHMLVNGELPELGLMGGWYYVTSTPKTIQELVPKNETNHTWTLKDSLKESILKEYPDLPEKIHSEYFPDEYDNAKFAYSLSFDTIDEHYIDVDFELIELESDKHYIPRYLSFRPYFATQDVITTPKLLLPSMPCAMSGKEIYKIIRDFVKKNINPKVAMVTSDHDFCFTVEKIVEVEPYKVKVDVSRTKRPKYETKIRTNKKVVVYQNSPEGWSGYPMQEDWHADSCPEMEDRINNYLADLIEKINTPVRECPTCKGAGVVLNDSANGGKNNG